MKMELSQRAGQAMKGIFFDDRLKSQFIAELEEADTFDQLPKRAQDVILFGEKNNTGFNDTPLPQEIVQSYGNAVSENQNRNLPSNYRPASSDDVPEGRNCGNCAYYGNGFCDWWDENVEPKFYCNKWDGEEEEDDEEEDDEMEEMEDEEDEIEIELELKAEINLVPPVFMRAAARRGIKLYEEGHGGDGLVRATVVDARKMMNGERLSEDKWKRIGPWIARHMVDLDAAKNNNPNDPGYPGAGLVAHLLWGSGPSKEQAKRAMDYANRIADRIDESRAVGGDPGTPAPKKDQIFGSKKNPKGSAKGKMGSITLDAPIEKALETKASDHNDAMAKQDKPEWTRVRVGALKSVWRRGAGAFSTSHRPGMTRAQWAMGRVNAFLYLARNGRPENAKYVGDNDLLHPDHPKYSKGE